MDAAIVEKLRSKANAGIDAIRTRHPDQASVHFNSALELADDLEDARTRRDEVSVLSTLFDHCGFPDLALLAAEEAVELDRSLELDDLLGQDIIAVGNAHLQLENVGKAEASFKEALEMFVKRGDWANAASANTNMAAIVANRGEMGKAITLLDTSLAYLAKTPFPDTEMQTRFALMQAMELEGCDVDRALANAADLCGRFWEDMREEQRVVARDFVDRAVQRYLHLHPTTKASAWKRKRFPMLYE